MPGKHETLADFVTRVMEEKGLSFRKVAEKSGNQMAHSTVADIANGQRFDIKKDTLIALAKGLEVPEDDLFRVARGLSTDGSSRFEIYAETFGADELTEEEWRMLEVYFQGQVNQFKALKAAASHTDKPPGVSKFKRKK